MMNEMLSFECKKEHYLTITTFDTEDSLIPPIKVVKCTTGIGNYRMVRFGSLKKAKKKKQITNPFQPTNEIHLIQTDASIYLRDSIRVLIVNVTMSFHMRKLSSGQPNRKQNIVYNLKMQKQKKKKKDSHRENFH